MKVPRVGKYALETVIASIYAKADIARNVTAKLIQSFGTGGGPSAEVTLATETWSLTTAWQMFDITSLVSNINGKTLGSAGDDGLILELGLPVNTSMTIDFAMGQIELGDVASKTHSRLPWSTEQGGSGGVYPSLTALAAAIMAVGTGSAGLAQAWDADLDAVAALGGTGFATRTAANTWAQRTLQQPAAGMTITNPAGIAGDPTFAFSTGLVNYIADPMSSAELASVTAPFGTAAFVNTGTSGGTVPLLNTAVTFSDTFTVNKGAGGSSVATVGGANNQGASFGLKANAGQSRSFGFYTGNTSLRWLLEATSTAESGANAGSDFNLSAWDDAGSFLSTPFSIARATGAITLTGQLKAAAGSAGTPSISFSGDPDTGIWRRAANQIGFAAGGVDVANVQSGGVEISVGGLFNVDGTAANPALTFTSDPNTGFWRTGADAVALSLGGTSYFTWSALQCQIWHDLNFGGAVNPLTTLSVGYRGIPNIAGDKSASYSPSAAVLTDAGAYIGFSATATYTIPTNANNAYPIGTTIMIENLNGGGTLTIHPDTGVTLRRGDGTAGTGDRIVAANSCVTIRKRGTNEWYIYGIFT